MANQVFNLIQQQKRAERQRPISIVRNFIIALGIVGMLAVIIMGVMSRDNGSHEEETAKSGTPVVLNTASPPLAPVLQLSKPVSIEQSFGRSQLTGELVEFVETDPLKALPFERRWDMGVPASVYKAPADLPAQPASDQVSDPPKQGPKEIAAGEFDDLPSDARKHVDVALTLHKDAQKLMDAVAPNHPDWSAKQGEAAELLKRARDALYEALKIAPDSRAVLDLMQQVKADLYSANKHRLK